MVFSSLIPYKTTTILFKILKGSKLKKKQKNLVASVLGNFQLDQEQFACPNHVLISFINIASQNGSTSVTHVLYVAGTSSYTIFQCIIFVLRFFNVHYQSLVNCNILLFFDDNKDLSCNIKYE